MSTTIIIILIISILLSIGLGFVIGFFVRVSIHEKSLKKSKELYDKIVREGKKEIEQERKEALAEARNEISNLKKECDVDIKERKKVVVEVEQRLSNREDQLNRRSQNLDRREETLTIKEEKLDEKNQELEQLNSKVEKVLVEQEQKLAEISGLTTEEAHKIIMNRVEQDMQTEIAAYIRDEEEKAKLEAQATAKNILSLAMQKYAADATSESTVSVVNLPNEEMKGRIIGREGRNIRTFEALTGVDIIIDDTPDAVVLSGFDPIRREVAKRSLDVLVTDGRIHPARIEEVVDKCQKEVDDFIYQSGENAVFQTGVGKMHFDLVKLVGKLNFRTSFGQNVLKHSTEVAFLAGKLAAEIGEDEIIARRAGLLHDIGKSIDHEVEGSHVEIGVNLATRYKEPKEVIDTIASHHGDCEPTTIIAVLVAAADALSAARPGARNESVENYIKRLEQLEEISNSVPGVKKSYAIQAGREIRVMVKPEEIDDNQISMVARNIKENIEKQMTYPGTIKVTVIREVRATDVAK